MGVLHTTKMCLHDDDKREAGKLQKRDGGLGIGSEGIMQKGRMYALSILFRGEGC
jgi:hypothetical protein